jgi:hypothetical protein
LSEQADRQVEELLRVNAELAAEIRSLAAARVADPPPGQGNAAGKLARLLAERDELAQRLGDTEVALEHTRADHDGLERQNREMDAEIARLRAGVGGFLRRLRAQLLNR